VGTTARSEHPGYVTDLHQRNCVERVDVDNSHLHRCSFNIIIMSARHPARLIPVFLLVLIGVGLVQVGFWSTRRPSRPSRRR
jgi:hypothetical protein